MAHTNLEQEDISVEYDTNNDSIITILKGDDAGVKFRYGKITIDTDENGEPAMSFSYEIISGAPVNKDDFVDSIAKLLHKMILAQLEQGELQYAGGTNEGLDEMNELNEAIAKKRAKVAEEAAAKMRESMHPKVYNEATSLIDSLGRQPDEFKAKPKESALTFLDRLAAQGQAEMNTRD